MNADAFPRNWLLTLAYDGTDYAGWQKQANAITVQSVLGEKLAKFYKCDVPIYGTSRTDSGVHALDQQVTLRLPEAPPIPVRDVFIGLNKLLPNDIRALALIEKEADFHARYRAAGKAYTYLIHRGPLRSPFLGRYMLVLELDLDVAAMKAAAADLVGTHDFYAFGANTRNPYQPDPLRTVQRIEIRELDQILMITVVGKSFLYKMVRRIVGFLINIGRGKVAADQAPQVLAMKDRDAGIETAMPHGLFLDRVFFDQQEMQHYQRTTLPFLDFL